MTEHPLYRMWRDRLEEELEKEKIRAERRAAREAERAVWYEAWRTYKAHRGQVGEPMPTPPWWDLLGWVRQLFRQHAPGGSRD